MFKTDSGAKNSEVAAHIEASESSLFLFDPMTLAKEPLPLIFFAARWWILNLMLSHYFCLTQLFQISFFSFVFFFHIRA